MRTKFGVNEWIATQIIQFSAFSGFIFRKCSAAAAAILQLQFGDNEQNTSLTIQFTDFTSLSFEKSAPAAAAVL